LKLLDIINSPWAIQRDKLREIQAIYATHLRGEKIDLEALEKRLGRPLTTADPEATPPYAVQDGVAVLQLTGVMAKRMNLFSQISGGTSTELATRDLRAAVVDPAVHSVVIVFDSPGGTVDGTAAFAAAIRAAAAVKPVVALADGTMASAAYWAGSAALAVYISEPTTQVGSIGVVAEHIDISARDAAAGIKRTEIVAGKFKRIASSAGPLSEEGQQTLQEQVDYTYSLFVQAVAAHRAVSVDTVLADMADGRIFIGQQAIDAGLVDGVSTLDALVAALNQDRAAGVPHGSRAKAHSITGPALRGQHIEETSMPITRAQLAADAPALIDELRAEGATAERARIRAVESAAIPGHEALIDGLKWDGKSNGGDAALAVNQAEKRLRTGAAVALAAEAPKPVPQAATAAVDAPKVGLAEDPNLPLDERCAAAWRNDAAIRAEFTSLEAYTALRRAEASGKVRQLGKRAA
jgi:signal peptide peptidase SppA